MLSRIERVQATLGRFWEAIDPMQQTLGLLVAFREVKYIVLTIAGIYIAPAYLLVDVGETWRRAWAEEGAGGAVYGPAMALVYIFAPEKFISLALASSVATRGSSIKTFLNGLTLFSVAFDLVGIAALVEAARSGHTLHCRS